MPCPCTAWLYGEALYRVLHEYISSIMCTGRVGLGSCDVDYNKYN